MKVKTIQKKGVKRGFRAPDIELYLKRLFRALDIELYSKRYPP
jgi:hypothetical protein